MLTYELSHYPLSNELRQIFNRVDDYVETMTKLGKKVEKVQVYTGHHQKARAFLKKVTGQPVGMSRTITYKGYPVADGGPMR